MGLPKGRIVIITEEQTKQVNKDFQEKDLHRGT